jgi:CheY-like chemotaxis protein
MKSIRKNLPTVLCTGYSDRIDDERAESLGISKFLNKPVNLKDLALALRQVLGETEPSGKK